LQAARIHFAAGAAMRAEIRDYCPNGLYVAFKEGKTPDAAIPVLMGARVQVAFAVDDSGVFRLNGHIAHISPGGVGVFVAVMPEGTLQALRTAGERLARTDFARTGADPTPQQAQPLLLECTRLFRSVLDAVMLDFFQRAVESLGEAGQGETVFWSDPTITTGPGTDAAPQRDRRRFLQCHPRPHPECRADDRSVPTRQQTSWPSSTRANSRTG
jgi:hypothetical protein